MTDITKLRESLEKLTISEALELVSECEEKWGVSAQASVASSDNSSASSESEEVSEVKVGIVGFENKMNSIKFLRSIKSELNLMDANKAITESSEAQPYELGSYEKPEADKLIAKAIENGAKAKIIA